MAVWPTHTLRASDGKHLEFVYREEPKELLEQYFEPGNTVRKVLNIHGRVRHRMHEAQIHGDDLVPFEVPML